MPPLIGIMCQAHMYSLQSMLLSIDMQTCFLAALLAMANSQGCKNGHRSILCIQRAVCMLWAPRMSLCHLLTAKMRTSSKGRQFCCMRRAAHPLPDAAGAVKVKGKKVISGFGAWGVKKKWESTFSPGSPVILKGKASRRNGTPLKRARLTACCQM